MNDPVLELLLPNPHAGQAEVASNDARFKVVDAGRRWGKSLLGVVKCLQCAGWGGEAMWAAPTYSMARIGWEPLVQIGRQTPGAQVRLADRELILPSGGRVRIRSADRPDSMRGLGLNFAVLDEAAYMQPQAWYEVVRPALADRGGHCLFISTPRGFNWFYDIWEAADSTSGWGRWQFPTHTNPHIPPAELEAARAEMGAHAYSQEFLAEFVEVEGGHIQPAWFQYATAGEEEGEPGWWLDEEWVSASDCWAFLTVDPAVSTRQSADYSVVTTCVVTPGQQLLIIDVQRGRWEAPDLLTRIVDTAQLVGPQWIGVEDVAYQRSLLQYLQREQLPVKALKPHGQDKVARAMPLIARLEGGDVWFLEDAHWLASLESELIRFPAGQHDDQVDTVAYAAREVFTGLTYTGSLGVR